MSYPQTQSLSSNYPHLYPQALQLKLYQAFIFSIPILFSIILFLLFYLFYLKKRFSPPPPPTLPRTLRIQPTHQFPPLNDQLRLKGNLKDKLSVILFDEDLRARDSQCCVCLGEFEMKEELQQIPLCKHVFHQHCISHWLQSNSTCPLCRCSVISFAKHPLSHPLVIPHPIAQEDPNFNPDQQMVSPDQGEQVIIVDTNLDNYYCSIEDHVVILVEGSSSTSTSR